VEKQIIVYYLADPDMESKLWEQAREVRLRIINLQEERDKLRNEIIYSGQIAIGISDTPKSKTNNLQDIGNVIENTDKKLKNYEMELLLEYNRILSEIDEYKRVHLVYDTLLPREREIIKKLYIENQKWEAVESDTGINHRILVDTINQIFNEISQKFDSSLSNTEIAKERNTLKLTRNRKKNKKSKTDKIKGQTDVYDFFPIKETKNDKKEQ
jgi:hypothetical protein